MVSRLKGGHARFQMASKGILGGASKAFKGVIGRYLGGLRGLRCVKGESRGILA